MNRPHSLSLATLALAFLFSSACEKQSSDLTRHIADLEQKANQAAERQQALEQEIEDQRLAAERDAIERERMRIEEDRLALEREQGDIDAAEAERIRLREQELALREGQLNQIQETLEARETEVDALSRELTERDRELAGREALEATEEATPAQPAPVADYGMFYDSLSSYGSWFETPDYGYVWQPVVIRDATWRPYTRGRWACTDRGWTWISDEPFGWATYHYGRWALLQNRGWAWVPGCEWAPSWVTWRYGSHHVGWAPLPPETLAYRGHRWGSSVEVNYGIGASWFNFVETRHFGGPIRGYCLPYSGNQAYLRQSVNVTNIYAHNNRIICGGPAYRDVYQRSARPVPFYRLEMDHYGRPGNDSLAMRSRVQGNRLRVVAPSMDVAWNDGLKPRTVRGRLDSIAVQRPQPLQPEITQRFAQSREQNRLNAERSIAAIGGREQLNRQRLAQLETNRHQLATRSQAMPSTRATGQRPIAQQARIQTAQTTGTTRTEQGPRVHPPKPAVQSKGVTTTAPSAIARQQARIIRADPSTRTPQLESARVNDGGPRISPSKSIIKPSVATLSPSSKPQANTQGTTDIATRMRQLEFERKTEGGPRIHPPKPTIKTTASPTLQKARVTTDQSIRMRELEAARKNEGGPRIHPPKPNIKTLGTTTRQASASTFARQKAQQALAEQARQRQSDATKAKNSTPRALPRPSPSNPSNSVADAQRSAQQAQQVRQQQDLTRQQQARQAQQTQQLRQAQEPSRNQAPRPQQPQTRPQPQPQRQAQPVQSRQVQPRQVQPRQTQATQAQPRQMQARPTQSLPQSNHRAGR